MKIVHLRLTRVILYPGPSLQILGSALAKHLAKYEKEYSRTTKTIGKHIWDKVFKNVPSKICERQSLKKLKRYGLLKQTISI